MSNRFLQIHTLTSYPAALLNRDDAGFAKRIPFGGVTRTRISSQCLKRHWRTFEGEHSFSEIKGAEMSVRSRLSFDRFVLGPLVKENVDKEIATAVVKALMAQVLGESAKAKKSNKKEDGKNNDVNTSQVTVLGHPELNFLLEQARKICKQINDPKKVGEVVKKHFDNEAKKNLKGLKMAAGLGAALFGRMVTSDILARGDAAVHVAHSFTVHAENSESDYFSAVDDLLAAEGELGSGHINSVELNSGLYYSYVAIDLPLLISNLEGCEQKDWQETDRKVAAEVIKRLVYIIATVSPGAKLGSTAPHAYAQMMLVEAGDSQPRSLANAFLKPVSEHPDLLANAYVEISRHIKDFDSTYGKTNQRCYLAMGPTEKLNLEDDKLSIDELAAWTAGRILEA